MCSFLSRLRGLLPLLALSLLVSASTYGKGHAFDDKIPDNRSTPQGLLKVFRTAMDKMALGDDSQIDRAIACFEDNPSLPPYLENTITYSHAEKLFIVMEDFDYVIDTLPIKIAGDKATAEFKGENLTLLLSLKRDQKGAWIFSPDIFKDKDFLKAYDDKSKELEASLRADLAGDTFLKDFVHPAKAYITFMLGMEEKNGLTIDDAVNALDLSEVNPLIRHDVGKVKAVLLYRLLLMQGINPSALSTRPNSNQAQLLVMAPGVGVIAMQKTFDPETKLCAWRVTAKSVRILEKVYNHFFAENTNTKFTNTKMPQIEFYFVIEDYLAKNAPSLKERFLGVKYWKWILIVASLVASPFMVMLARRVLDFLVGLILKMASKQHEDRLKRAVILPSLIIFMVGFWYKLLAGVYMPAPVLIAAVYIRDITVIILYAWLTCLLVDIIALVIRDRILRTGEETKENLLVVIMSRLAKIIITLVAAMNLIMMFGVDGWRLLAALGVGGVALALAGKDTVENVFGSLMIMLERPFELGDMIT